VEIGKVIYSLIGLAHIMIKKTLFYLLLAIIIASMFQFALGVESSWSEKAPMQVSRGRLGVAVVEGKIYAIGGDNGAILGGGSDYIAAGTGAIVNTNEEYDPSKDSWTFKEPMPTARDHFGIAVYKDRIYCFGGQMRNSSGVYACDITEVYDPATDTWQRKADMPFSGRFLMANALGNKIYVVGAVDCSNINLQYDPSTDSWSIKTPPNGLLYCGSVKIGEKLYFLSQENSTSPYVFFKSYDVASDRWTDDPLRFLNSTADRSSGSIGTIPGSQNIYFFNVNSTYVYNFQNSSWSMCPSIPTSRGFAGIAVLDNTIFLIGGENLPTDYFGGLMSPIASNELFLTSDSVQQTNEPSLSNVFFVIILVTVSIVSLTVGLLYTVHNRQEAKYTNG
jgi:hypothetical protein